MLASRFRVLPNKMEQRHKVVRDIILTCVVFDNMLRTHQGRVAREPNQQDEVATIVNEPVVCGADKNCGNSLTMLVQWRGKRR